ncbi:phage tail length tape measure family protein [Pelomonas sp. V22]|uniref:phage tail length tape measure family protein n=1 Tax=Pelomonas sp. V22 TaxID=2822139 RepID=UPI0024A92ACE|nr:phage tail length tape measure family protein [Pelomonas sp. V22]MDI4633287.1 phage tail length tape measure family protein [Pelomonas sp. V22]
MSENQKPQIKLEVDSTEARKGFNEIKDAARDMATSVNEAGKKAGAGLEGIGDGAPKSAEKLDRATKSIIGSIERTTAAMKAGERGTASYFETLASQRGVSADTLKPYLDQLRQAEAAQKAAQGSLDKMGVSAAQTAAALRGVPAQFTDIVTALQGGQQPLTVFLQQGGQLKDMFGGAGNAARALGGYVLGLVNPFTVAAAAVVGLGVAYSMGAAEAKEFEKTLILSGNQAGKTASQLMDMAAAVRSMGAGTQGRAAEVINLMASDSKIGADNIQRFTAAILQMERAGGPAAEELVKQFASLAKSPLESALKLNETTGFLTRSVYEQIRALEDAGRTTDAAKVAQEAYARAVEQRSPELVKNLGYVEKAWLGIKDAAKGAIDNTLSVGRVSTADSVRRKLLDLSTKSLAVDPDSVAGKSLQRQTADLERQLVVLEAKERIEAKAAAAKAEEGRQVKLLGDFNKESLQFASKQVQQEKELAAARVKYQELVEAGLISSKQYRDLLAGIRDKFDDKGAKSEVDSIKAKIVETQKYIDLLRAGRGEEAKQTEGEKLVAQLQEQLRGRMDGITRGYKEQALAQAQKLVAVERDSLETEKLYKYVAQATDAYRKQIAETVKSADAIELQAQKQDAANKVFGESKTAIEEMVLAQKKIERTKFLEGELVDPAQLAALDSGIKAQEHLVDSLRTADFNSVNRRMDEWLRSAKEAEAIAASELRIVGLGSAERAKVLLTRESELKLAKQIAEIDRSSFDEAQKNSLKDKAKAAAKIELDVNLDRDALKAIDEYLDPSRAQSFGAALSDAFGNAGNSLAKLSSSLGEYARQQAQVADLRSRLADIKDPAERQREALRLSMRSQEQSIGLYANMAGAAKGFFAEGSRGYKTLQAAEDAFRVYQLASDLQKGLSAAAVGIANQAQGDPYSAIPRMAAMAAIMAGLGFAVSGGFAGGGSTGGDGAKQATGTGTVFGDAQAKSESIAKSIDLLSDTAKMQLSTQSGMLAALKSIEANIGGLSGLILRSGVVSGDTASQFGIREGYGLNAFNAFGKTALGILDSWTAGVFTKLMGSKTTITGNGLFSGPQSLGSILTGGLNLQDYADVNSKSKFLGITYSNKNSTQYQASDPVLKQQFGLVFQSFADALKLASVPLGASLDEVVGRINSFTVDIGKIDLKDLTGQQIQEKLSAVLGAAGDSIASAALPGLNDFQKIGEGYLETVIRVASGVETASASLDLLGIQAIKFTGVAQKQGDVGAEIVRQSIKAFESLDGSLSGIGAIIDSLSGSAEELAQAYTELDGARQVLIAVGKSGDSLTAAMLRGAGGLDNLKSSLETYFDAFFTDQEKAAAKQAQLAADFAKIGITSAPTSREAFKALVSGIDTSTEAGQKFYAQVIGLAGAFDEALKATEKLAGGVSNLQDVLSGQAKTRSGLQVDLLTAQGDAAGAAALKRQLDLAGITGGLSAADAAAVAASYDLTEALRAQIKATQEAAAAAQRVLSERAGLETQLLQAQGDTAALRERELAALDPSNRALKQMIYALEDQAKVSAKAAEAAQKVTDAMAGLGDTRFDLENQLLSLSGNDAEVLRRTRERDLARLTEGMSAEDAAKIAAAYDFNTALKQQIDSTNAAAQAAEAIAKAQQQAAEDARRAAEEQQRAAEQISSAWKSAADSVLDEVARIRGQIAGDSSESLAQAQTRLAITQAQAKAGDLNAFKLLPGLSQAMLSIAEQQSVSFADLQSLRARTAAGLEGTANLLASQYGVAKAVAITGVTPTTAAQTAIQPASFTPTPATSGTESMVEELKSLREQLIELRKQIDVSNNNTGRAAEALEGNQSVPILVEIAP